jgi:hypothetical protein
MLGTSELEERPLLTLAAILKVALDALAVIQGTQLRHHCHQASKLYAFDLPGSPCLFGALIGQAALSFSLDQA